MRRGSDGHLLSCPARTPMIGEGRLSPPLPVRAIFSHTVLQSGVSVIETVSPTAKPCEERTARLPRRRPSASVDDRLGSVPCATTASKSRRAMPRRAGCSFASGFSPPASRRRSCLRLHVIRLHIGWTFTSLTDTETRTYSPPRKAGVQRSRGEARRLKGLRRRFWMPACAGMTMERRCGIIIPHS
jgi:hypothetical protein